MPRKYVYRTEYVEKNPYIKFRKCLTCKKMVSIKKLENSFTCKVCYVKKYGLKRCKKCNLLKYISNFHKNYMYKDGYYSQCGDCRYEKTPKVKQKEGEKKEYLSGDKGLVKTFLRYEANGFEERGRQMRLYHGALRRARVRNACPKWADLDKIKEIYKNCPKSYHVDHIIPLTNQNICGLHVPENLQYLPASTNIRKGNRF